MASPFLNSKYVPSLEPANPLYCILVWSIYTIYVSGKLVQGGEHTSKLKMVINLFLKLLTENKFVLIHVSMIHMCNIVKTKASKLQQYLLCLVVYQNIATKTIGNYVFISKIRNFISGVRK